jgi:hypothetical protein
MSMRWLAAGLPLLLAACAHEPQLLGEPDRVWASPRGLEATASCVIRNLDERGRRNSNIAPSLTHAKRVIEPGKVYEIRPEQKNAVGPESYYVRLEKVDDHITRIALYAKSPWTKSMISELAPCGRVS